MFRFVIAMALVAAPCAAQTDITMKRVPGTNWATWSQTDAMTDRRNARVTLFSNDRKTRLEFYCDNGGKRPDLGVQLVVPFDSGDSLTRVTFRVGKDQPTTGLQTARNELVGLSSAEWAVKMFTRTDPILVRIEDRLFVPHDTEFSPNGGESALRNLYQACAQKYPG